MICLCRLYSCIFATKPETTMIKPQNIFGIEFVKPNYQTVIKSTSKIAYTPEIDS